MPELPEVETIRFQLEKYIVGSVIKEIEIKNKKYEINTEHVLDKKIIGVRRFAKQLAIDLENNYSIMIHVKMTGQLIYEGKKLQKSKTQKLSPKVTGGLGGKHTHLIFRLDDGDLYYNDVRQFGWIKVVKNEELKAIVFAPEPLKDLNAEHFLTYYLNQKEILR